MPEQVTENDIAGGSTPASEQDGAAEALRAFREENEEPEDVESTPEESPEEGEEPEDVSPDDSSPADEGEGEDDDDVPELSDIILDPDADPTSKKKAWANHWRGIQKRENRVKAFEDELTGLTTAELDTARATALNFIDQIAEARGISREDFLGLKQQSQEWQGGTNEYGLELPPGFQSEKEYELHQRLEKWEQAQENERRQARQEAEMNAYVERIADKTIRQAEKTLHGFKVSRDMVAKAVREFPGVEPLLAVKRHFVDAIVEHTTKTVRTQSSSRGPELLPRSESRGVQRKSADELSYRDFLKEFNER